MEGNILLTRAQVAEAFQVSKKTIRRWEQAGRLPVVTISRNVIRYRQGDVLKLVESLRNLKRA